MANGNRSPYNVTEAAFKTFKEILEQEQFSCPVHILLLILFLSEKKRKSANCPSKRENKQGKGQDSWVCNMSYTLRTSDNCGSDSLLPFQGKAISTINWESFWKARQIPFPFLPSGSKKREKKGSTENLFIQLNIMNTTWYVPQCYKPCEVFSFNPIPLNELVCKWISCLHIVNCI